MNLLETVEQDTMPTHYKQMTQAEMIARVTEIKAQLGENLFIPCHHYQKDEGRSICRCDWRFLTISANCCTK